MSSAAETEPEELKTFWLSAAAVLPVDQVQGSEACFKLEGLPQILLKVKASGSWCLECASHSQTGPLQEASLLFGAPGTCQHGQLCRPRKVQQQIWGRSPLSSSHLPAAKWQRLSERGLYGWVSQNGNGQARDHSHHFGFACNGRLLLDDMQFGWAGELKGLKFTTKWEFCQNMEAQRGPEQAVKMLAMLQQQDMNKYMLAHQGAEGSLDAALLWAASLHQGHDPYADEPEVCGAPKPDAIYEAASLLQKASVPSLYHNLAISQQAPAGGSTQHAARTSPALPHAHHLVPAQQQACLTKQGPPDSSPPSMGDVPLQAQMLQHTHRACPAEARDDGHLQALDDRVRTQKTARVASLHDAEGKPRAVAAHSSSHQQAADVAPLQQVVSPLVPAACLQDKPHGAAAHMPGHQLAPAIVVLQQAVSAAMQQQRQEGHSSGGSHQNNQQTSGGAHLQLTQNKSLAGLASVARHRQDMDTTPDGTTLQHKQKAAATPQQTGGQHSSAAADSQSNPAAGALPAAHQHKSTSALLRHAPDEVHLVTKHVDGPPSPMAANADGAAPCEQSVHSLMLQRQIQQDPGLPAASGRHLQPSATPHPRSPGRQAQPASADIDVLEAASSPRSNDSQPARHPEIQNSQQYDARTKGLQQPQEKPSRPISVIRSQGAAQGQTTTPQQQAGPATVVQTGPRQVLASVNGREGQHEHDPPPASLQQQQQQILPIRMQQLLQGGPSEATACAEDQARSSLIAESQLPATASSFQQQIMSKPSSAEQQSLSDAPTALPPAAQANDGLEAFVERLPLDAEAAGRLLGQLNKLYSLDEGAPEATGLLEEIREAVSRSVFEQIVAFVTEGQSHSSRSAANLNAACCSCPPMQELQGSRPLVVHHQVPG
ncbi:hypothetical protein WJX74_000818 [Apatococcus lobatus]|uniref:Uncharacterized protein n=1 Tax=Apatococcus lobatus TaxID=904363 RepID=A0AAW1QB78_9CHLO